MNGKIGLILLLQALVGAVGLNFVSNALGSHMVLQRAPQKANLWGWSKTVGSTVEVGFNGKTYKAVSASGGAWSVQLDPTAAGGPYQITVKSSAGENAVLDDVLFGDVWICSGQSNMQMTVSETFNASTEIQLANKYPNIRLFTVGQKTTSTTPLSEFATIEQQWSVASSASVGGADWAYFSATCWYFGRDLYDNLQVPLGLMSTNWGGTPVQAWSSPDALAECPKAEEDAIFVSKRGPGDPSQLYNAMIVPILPMRSRGAIWYQAEANVGQTAYYTCVFPAMISDWRKKWGYTPDQFPFFFVQLSTWFPSNMELPAMRQAQAVATGLPYVGMATAMDIGDALSPYNVIHPRDKQDVGKRLALVARGIAYNQKVQYLGPTATFASAVSSGPKAIVEVHFRKDSLAQGMTLIRTPVCPPQVNATLCGTTFELQTSDGIWHTALGSLASGDTIHVSATVAAGLVPTGVRYAYYPWPLATLYNLNGNYNLPATPFNLAVSF